jgi:methyltransferase (TIGR00027 family)
MRDEGPSRTAIGVAIQRAAHQVLDHPVVFADPLAMRIIGPRARAAIEAGRAERSAFAPLLRAVLAVRSRVAEEALADAYARGVRQYVVLGAGLDTFALRNPLPGLQVFEVDHPNTQRWKRARLAEEGLAPPPRLHFVAVDFERQDLRTELLAAGLDRSQPAFFSWLGVVMYLEALAIRATLRAVASLCGAEGGIAFDFIAAPKASQILLRWILWWRARRVARLGEPFRSFLDPERVREWLIESGFRDVSILTSELLGQRYLSGRTDRLRINPLARVVVARDAKA